MHDGNMHFKHARISAPMLRTRVDRILRRTNKATAGSPNILEVLAATPESHIETLRFEGARTWKSTDLRLFRKNQGMI